LSSTDVATRLIFNSSLENTSSSPTSERPGKPSNENRKCVFFKKKKIGSERQNSFHLQQAEATLKRRAERAEAFVAPQEEAAPTVEEKRKRRHVDVDGEDGTAKSKKKKKKDSIAEYT
jgi:ribosomal RNA assembly protein